MRQTDRQTETDRENEGERHSNKLREELHLALMFVIGENEMTKTKCVSFYQS